MPSSSSDCYEFLLEARAAIVDYLEQLPSPSSSCDSASPSFADTAEHLATLAEQLSQSCSHSSHAEYQAAFGAVRYGQLGNIDLRIEQLAQQLLDGSCSASCVDGGSTGALPSTTTLDEMCTRSDLVEIVALLETMIKQAELARSVHQMDQRELQRALEDAEEKVAHEERLQASRAQRRATQRCWNDPHRNPNRCPSLRCTRYQLCEECTRARRQRQTGERFVQKYLRDNVSSRGHRRWNRWGSDSDTCNGDECSADYSPYEGDGDADAHDSNNSNASLDRAVQWRNRLTTMMEYAQRMQDVILHTRTELRRLKACARRMLVEARYTDADGGYQLVAVPSDHARLVQASIDSERALMKHSLHDLRNYARMQRTNRIGALHRYYYIDTYRTLGMPGSAEQQQCLFLQLAHRNARNCLHDTAREALASLGHCCGTVSARQLLIALAHVDTARDV